MWRRITFLVWTSDVTFRGSWITPEIWSILVHYPLSTTFNSHRDTQLNAKYNNITCKYMHSTKYTQCAHCIKQMTGNKLSNLCFDWSEDVCQLHPNHHIPIETQIWKTYVTARLSNGIIVSNVTSVLILVDKDRGPVQVTFCFWKAPSWGSQSGKECTFSN